MFGRNEKVGEKYFKDAGDKLFITSRFYTLQGEGPFSGLPAVFIRFSKCQLACSFCDTFFDDGDWYTVPELVEEVKLQIEGKDPKNIGIVITGGEPMLQKNIKPLIEALDQFRFVQIESNGILCQDIPERTTLVVSPKCMEKNGIATKYMRPNPKTLERADCLKFVMSAPTEQFHPYQEIPDWALEWREKTGKEIFVSPMNIYNEEPQKSKELRTQKNYIAVDERSKVDEKISFWDEGLLNMEENQKNHEYTAQYCLEHNLRLQLQVHLYASMS